jgi:radical SAM superfamily enzyme YgiQ (UPF0313 family)
MERVDCLFIHVPKSRNDCRPIDQSIGINFLPMGLLGLADLLQRNGVSTQIVHMGVEWIENHDFSILHYIREKVPRIVAVDLDWHHQSFDAIETAKKVKAEFPSVYVLLGGFTASFFHEEIMRNFDVVDGILRGEAEGPILELARVLLEGTGDLFSVSNLTWRRKGRVLVNPLSYVASEKDLNSLSFTNFPLLKNYRTYIHYIGQPLHAKGGSKERNFRADSLESPTYHLTVGRGCPVQCTWCSGNIPSQETVTGRREVIFRGVEEVLQSIREAISYGYESFHICFDPYPQRPEYFLNLFSRIRQEKIQMECFFESFGLPTIDFIKSFRETFPGPKSLIALSPDVGSDPGRKMHKGNAYTNQDLMDCLDQLKKHEVSCDLFFILGVPFEKEEDICQTARLQREVRNRYPNVREIHTYTAQMEPGSPWHLDPESFRVKTSLKNFLDFYHYHSGEESPSSSLGYWIPGYFQEVEDEIGFEERLQDIIGRSFCSIHPNAGKSSGPFWGKRFCDLSSVFWKMKRLAKGKM